MLLTINKSYLFIKDLKCYELLQSKYKLGNLKTNDILTEYF